MKGQYLKETFTYRGYEIDLIQYTDGEREYGVVTDRITVATEGYLATYPTREEAERRVDEIEDTPPDPSFDDFLRKYTA